jgi:hypothetical protein
VTTLERLRAVALIGLLVVPALAAAADAPPASEIMPPRLSFVDGAVSFWRPGAQDWAPARVNTPLAAGDSLYAGERANLEIQIGPRAFVRAAERTQLGIVAIEPDFVQLKLTGGQAALDLRSIAPGHTVELDTPNAVFTVEHPGYYRVSVGAETTYLVTRRGGRATVTAADGAPQTVSASEEIVIRGTASPVLETYVAPELDAWDRWNYARTDYEIEALSARYVSPGIYGVGVLDQWGAWRVVPTYGAVWIPRAVAPGWAPYSAGSWVWDPYYGWTWIDTAPWGWAPFHYGRWVVVDGFWAWAPGPLILRPVYAPALVAFFSVSAAAGPSVGWVALGWGEPLLPWWGRPGFIGVPWWGGWGGPRIVNNVVVERTVVVKPGAIVHQHIKTPRAVSVVPEKRFGSGPVRGERLARADPRELGRIADAHPVRPRSESFVPERRDTVRPPAGVASRPVIETRPPKRADTGTPLPRPSFGTGSVERRPPPQPPRPPSAEVLRRAAPVASAPRRLEPQPKGGRLEQPRALPGSPANGALPRQSHSPAPSHLDRTK